MKFLFLESFYGGSHRDFADGLIAHSQHQIDLVTLPARFWKWRMRGAALNFLRRVPSPQDYDGLIVTDLLSLSDLKSFWGARCPPSLVYFHENQLSYPLPEGESMDYQFGFTDITNALAADRILFNSHTHRDAFLADLPGFIGKMPEAKPLWVVDVIKGKSGVLYPGCHFPAGELELFDGPAEAVHIRDRKAEPPQPLIVWNHRWEFDKGPEAFFDALDAALSEGREFWLALLGENFQKVPQPFLAARKRYGKRVLRYGYVESKQEYQDWLKRADCVISTSIQENFGISVVEAVRFGCFPLLPGRLSYPELIPGEFHGACLYRNEADLAEKLCAFLTHLDSYRRKRQELAASMKRFAWERVCPEYDSELESLAGERLS